MLDNTKRNMFFGQVINVSLLLRKICLRKILHSYRRHLFIFAKQILLFVSLANNLLLELNR